MYSKKLVLSAVLIAAGIWVSTASAQDAPTCGNITFNADVVANHAEIADHCLEIVTREDGSPAVRMHARVMRQSPAGTFIRYEKPDGSYGETRKANPPGGMKANIGGQDVAISDLAVRQEVNVYVSNAFWAGPAAPVAYAEPEPEPEPEPMPEALPTTASNLPLLAAIGAMLLLLGGIARVVRNRS